MSRMSEATQTKIEPNQMQGDSFSYIVRDNNGDFHSINMVRCKICSQFMGSEPHRACLRVVEERKAMEREQLRQQECIKKYGQVLDSIEEQRRDFPTQRVYGHESYNDQLKREAERKRQERFEELRQRRVRKQRLIDIDYERKQLVKAIANDDRLEQEEKVQGLEV